MHPVLTRRQAEAAAAARKQVRAHAQEAVEGGDVGLPVPDGCPPGAGKHEGRQPAQAAQQRAGLHAPAYGGRQLLRAAPLQAPDGVLRAAEQQGQAAATHQSAVAAAGREAEQARAAHTGHLLAALTQPCTLRSCKGIPRSPQQCRYTQAKLLLRRNATPYPELAAGPGSASRDVRPSTRLGWLPVAPPVPATAPEPAAAAAAACPAAPALPALLRPHPLALRGLGLRL